jgi:hypothetical protein
MNVTFTLTTLSTAAGPFNISGTTSANVTTQLASGLTANQLASGYTINSVNDTITGGTIASTGTCNTTKTWLAISSTPTPTPTVTATPPPLNLVVVSTGGDGATACTNRSNNQYTFDVYTQFHQLVDGDTLYADALGSTVFVGSGGFYSDGTTFGKINSSGLYTQLDSCPV